MPNLDGRGPQGLGPTGRGQGSCMNNIRSFGCKLELRKPFAGFCAVEQGDEAVIEAKIKAHQAKIDFLQKLLKN